MGKFKVGDMVTFSDRTPLYREEFVVVSCIFISGKYVYGIDCCEGRRYGLSANESELELLDF